MPALRSGARFRKPIRRHTLSLGVASSRLLRRARALVRNMASEGVLPLLRPPSPEGAPLYPASSDPFQDEVQQRVVSLASSPSSARRYLAGNAVCNQKYSIFTFLPLVLYEQFSMFYNLFFLLVALSQFIPPLRVGFFWTYFGPLLFVLLISISKEALDDLARFRRDRRINLVPYTRLRTSSSTGEMRTETVASRDIRVGDVLMLESDDRVPADCVLLRAIPNEGALRPSTPDGSASNPAQSQDAPDSLFIRTDQLDGETDWKLRRPIASTQALRTNADILHCGGIIEAEPPKREIYDFVGNFVSRDSIREPLTVENTLWANTVVASGRAVCLVVYNGEETRSKLNQSTPRSKVGTLDNEVNFMSKLLFGLLFLLSAILTALRGFSGSWFLLFFRYFLLLSAIIPISMRVNLDMAKVAYTYFIENDPVKMPGCTVRNSNLPEELGRVEYLLTDKTGTLTQNEMTFKKLHVGTVLFARDSLEDVCSYLREAFKTHALEQERNAEILDLIEEDADGAGSGSMLGRNNFDVVLSPRRSPTQVSRRARIQTQVLDALLAIALAHNVAPVEENGNRTYEAASPDEVALVRFAESVGLVLQERSMSRIVLRASGGTILSYDILAEFPFTSEAKRMGIIVQSRETAEITLYVKGADSVISQCVQYNDWLDEECGNLAREGLRTLVFAKRTLSPADYERFSADWLAARTSPLNRKEAMANVQSGIETNMQLLALTGVEDRLQPNVRETLEKLRHAGIKIWMLTGDKVETATCIAVSSRLAERSQGMFTITGITSRNEAMRALSRFKTQSSSDVLIVDGTSLQTFLDMFAEEFMEVVASAPAAVACRCSPTQKAEMVRLLQEFNGKRVAAIGDGGNDVSMIQQAQAGIGIPGKEGMQASLAADFSVTSFSHLTRLLLWHGRNSYKRSARLAQFVIHRGLIISIIQTVYCALFFYAAISVYSGWILVGYATLFTMFPVFSLVLDEDVNEHAADTYPELYKDLQKGRSLNLKTFLIWVFKSIYQGTMIMVFSVYVLWDDEFFTTLHLSAISFTSLIFTELLMVSFEVHNWHYVMVIAQACSLVFYLASILILKDTFDASLIFKWGFLFRVLLVTLISCLPVTIGKCLKRRFAPAATTKLA